MATAYDIVKGALRKLGVKASGQSLTAEEGSDALEALNDLIDSWSNERLMLPHLTQVFKVLTANDGVYSIGLGSDIDVSRPVSIESAFIRTSSDYDSTVTPISDEQYSRITTKAAPSGIPGYLYYRPTYPLGQINLYPVPSSGLTLFMNVWAQIGSFATLATDITLPEGYKRALEWNLALEIAPEYREPSQLIIMMAKDSKSWIKTVNSKEIPILRSPLNFRGSFDIHTGE